MTSQNANSLQMMPITFFWETASGVVKSFIPQSNLEATKSIISRSVETGADITLLYAQGMQDLSKLLMDMGNQNFKCSVDAAKNFFKAEGMETKLAYQAAASKEAVERGLFCMQKCFEQLSESNAHASEAFQGYVGEVAENWKDSEERVQKTRQA